METANSHLFQAKNARITRKSVHGVCINNMARFSPPPPPPGERFPSQSSCTNLYCGLINVISCITYILYKVVVSCITQCVTRSSRKLMMAQRLEATDHVYIPIQGLPRWLRGKESTCNAGDVGLILELRRSPGE